MSSSVAACDKDLGDRGSCSMSQSHEGPCANESSFVKIAYTNYAGKKGTRLIYPTGRVYHGSNRWHPKPQWMLEAINVEDGLVKSFPLLNIHSWEERS